MGKHNFVFLGFMILLFICFFFSYLLPLDLRFSWRNYVIKQMHFGVAHTLFHITLQKKSLLINVGRSFCSPHNLQICVK